MEKLQDTINSKRFKHIMHAVLAMLMIGWVVFRFGAVASENARYVFNASRVAADVGMPVYTVNMENKKGVLYEPLAIKNNRAYVTGDRAENLCAGQRVGSGEIVSVSRNIDLDTGMFVVRTRGVEDGLHYAEFTANGFFVPLYAIRDNTVFVVQNGIAVARDITIARQDSETAYIASGLNAGDVVILSSVNAGDKVSIQDNTWGI
jgi:hypothetical protein